MEINNISQSDGMWRMLQHSERGDFVLATGKSHSVREFCELAFKEAGIELEWQGEGVEERGVVKSINQDKIISVFQSANLSRRSDAEGGTTRPAELDTIERRRKTDHPINQSVIDSFINTISLGDKLVFISPGYYRPTEVDLLIGDAGKVKKRLGWEAETKVEKLVKIMIQSDFNKIVEKGY